MKKLTHPDKLIPGDKVAVLSPSFAAPAVFPAVHNQAMTRLVGETGLVPVEYATTRQLGASPQERARDFNAALADPEIRGILSTIGGSDQIRLIRHLDPDLLLADPKPFLGYSDNTNILNWMWNQGVASFYGGSTQVQIGPGPRLDPEHSASLRAALLTGDELEVTEPGESEDFGITWEDSACLAEFGERELTEPWTWAGPPRKVTGITWGGCLDVLDWIAIADRFPSNEDLNGAVLLLETSETLPSADMVRWWVRALGERGLLEAVAAVLFARSPASAIDGEPPIAKNREKWREARRDAVIEEVSSYNPNAVVCVGPPFGHTRPQWILPYGGQITVDGTRRQIFASYT
ncbi:S66 peptidase family protein [Actinomycetaceae bacterium MB13-C1-2]|nr:S66 peptidase family protein [Actinomycetaceae bacterium MB13-C1-2]